jgi:hypothetical protein
MVAALDSAANSQGANRSLGDENTGVPHDDAARLENQRAPEITCSALDHVRISRGIWRRLDLVPAGDQLKFHASAHVSSHLSQGHSASNPWLVTLTPRAAYPFALPAKSLWYENVLESQ